MPWWEPPGPCFEQEDHQPEPPDLGDVEWTPNPVVGVLLGPDGEPVAVLHERPVIPVGFRPVKEVSCWEEAP